MRRALPFRFATAVLAAWYVVIGVQPNGMHAMTMGGMSHAQAAHHVATDEMAGMPDMAGHDSAPTKQDQSNDCGRHDCCCVTTVVLLPQGTELLWLPAQSFVRELPQPVERPALPVGEHVIPFAIGPPGTLAS